MSTVASLVFEMSANVARLQQDMSKARSTVEGAMDGIKSAVQTAKYAIEALGVAWAVDKVIDFAHSAIEAQNAMYELALRTGMSVEMLSALRPVARQAGTDLDTVATLVNRLERNLYEFAATGKGKAADTFKQLGFSGADAKKALADMNAFLPDFARRLLESGTQGEVSAMAMQLMGRNGAQALPLFHALAEAQSLHATATREDTERAHEFVVQLETIKNTAQVAKEQLVNEFVPALNKIAKAFAEAQKEGGLFAGVLAAYRTALTGDDLYKANKEIYDLTDRKLQLENKIAELKQAPFEFGVKGGGGVANLQKELADVEARLKVVRDYKQMLEDQDEAERKAAEARAVKRGQSHLQLGAGPEEEKLFIRSRQQLEEELGKINNLSKTEIVINRLTEGSWKSLTAAHQAELLALAGEYDDRKRVLDVQKAAVELAQIEAAESDRARIAIQDQAGGYREQIDQLKFETTLIGQSAREQQKINALRQIDLDVRRRIAALPEPEDAVTGNADVIDEIMRTAQRQKVVIADLSQSRQEAERDWVTGAREGFHEYVDEATNAAAMSRQLFSDAFHGMENSLVNFTRTGKLDFKNFIDSIATDIARIEVRKNITGPLAEALGGIDFGSVIKGIFSGGGGSAAEMAGYDALMGFADGGSFTVGGSGGTDSQLVAFRATPGEQVSVGAPGSGEVHAHVHIAAGVGPAVRAEVMAMMPQLQRAMTVAVQDARRRGGRFADDFKS